MTPSEVLDKAARRTAGALFAGMAAHQGFHGEWFWFVADLVLAFVFFAGAADAPEPSSLTQGEGHE